jgi:hypothetical protein
VVLAEHAYVVVVEIIMPLAPSTIHRGWVPF